MKALKAEVNKQQLGVDERRIYEDYELRKNQRSKNQRSKNQKNKNQRARNQVPILIDVFQLLVYDNVNSIVRKRERKRFADIYLQIAG